MKFAVITGTSRGLGLGMASAFLEKYKVIGISRKESPLLKENPGQYFHLSLDLEQLTKIESRVINYLENLSNQHELYVEYLILNSAVLGPIKDMYDTSLEEIQEVMNINVWANKILLDTFFLLEEKQIIRGPEKILAMSSGASHKGERGWNAYSISKAALNVMIKLYSEERKEKHFISLAPGIIHTDMQDEIYHKKIDLEKYPSFKRLYEARGTEKMPSPNVVGKTIFDKLSKIFSSPSGSYVDIRTI
ncbi:MAG: SDR family NAD(P)-dependent oxidoreductase [Leptospiraceae bacterium]|nr:SDR family NAD(P)-dependent oxidoreductase [Leptospiraceae bacterium]MDW7975309.1 SDR family NAD(P)-dependent oxidoreductase [Leptospiraceae bacterium]